MAPVPPLCCIFVTVYTNRLSRGLTPLSSTMMHICHIIMLIIIMHIIHKQFQGRCSARYKIVYPLPHSIPQDTNRNTGPIPVSLSTQTGIPNTMECNGIPYPYKVEHTENLWLPHIRTYRELDVDPENSPIQAQLALSLCPTHQNAGSASVLPLFLLCSLLFYSVLFSVVSLQHYTRKATTMLHRGVDISLKVSHAHPRLLFDQKKGIRR